MKSTMVPSSLVDCGNHGFAVRYSVEVGPTALAGPEQAEPWFWSQDPGFASAANPNDPQCTCGYKGGKLLQLHGFMQKSQSCMVQNETKSSVKLPSLAGAGCISTKICKQCKTGMGPTTSILDQNHKIVIW